MSCVFGFDVGSRLTGVAVGNQLTATAQALASVSMREGEPDWRQLDALRASWEPRALVVGLPLTLDGGEQPASRHARQFAQMLQARYDMPVALVDERDSSREAAQRFAAARAAGQRRRRDAATLDAQAAAVILERWLLEQASAPPTASLPHKTNP